MQYLDGLYLKGVNLLSNAFGKIPFLLADPSDNGGVDLSEITKGNKDGGTFSSVVTATTGLSKDVYTTLMIIGGFGGVLMLIIAFIIFGIAGSGNKKDEAKSKIATVLLAVAGIFAAVFIVGLFQKIGVALQSQEVK